VFECLACNLLQISPLKLKLCFEKLRFKTMYSQNAGNAISETQILKISWGSMPPEPPTVTRACGTRLTASAITYYLRAFFKNSSVGGPSTKRDPYYTKYGEMIDGCW
jgi:hypothetical protein